MNFLWLLANDEPAVTDIAVASFTSGALLGFSQWLVLRAEGRRAAWWLPAAMLGGAIGDVVAGLLVQPELPPRSPGDVRAEIAEVIELEVNVPLKRGFIRGAAFGGLTGLVLYSLLKQRPRDLSDPPPSPASSPEIGSY
jgi:hypothetical protein